MKHRVAGRKLGRTSAHRLAVLRNLSTDLFRHERIQTTLMKAKELRPFAERLITLGRRADIHARRRLARHIHDRDIARKLVDTISTRFAERPGGYTRILKLGPRRGDSAEMAIIELIGSEPSFAPKAETKKEQRGLGRIRERFSRKKAAPAESAKAVEGETGEGKPKRGKAPRASGGSEPDEGKKSARKAAGKKGSSAKGGRSKEKAGKARGKGG